MKYLLLLVLALALTGCASVGHSYKNHATPTSTLSPITSETLPSREVSELESPNSIWSRIRAGFAIPNLESPLVTNREAWYVRHQALLYRMTQQSSKYLYYIVQELERRGMPTELALLPFVESAYNPQAVSEAKAVGIWQFMPATGTNYDLTQNAFRDDRRDVMASTRAALDYLQYLHGLFGSWQLALAAYNWGAANVAHALAFNETQGRPTTYSALIMPEETRMYYPKLQALKNIVSDPAAFGVRLADISNHAYFDAVAIRHDMDVAKVAQLADMSEQSFRQLNPAYKGPVIFAATTHQILLPAENAQIFRRNLADYKGGELSTWTVWTTPRRMRVSQVAQHVGVNEAVLRSVNHIPYGMLIEAGSALLVPRRGGGDVTKELAQEGQLRLARIESPRRDRYRRSRYAREFREFREIRESRELRDSRDRDSRYRHASDTGIRDRASRRRDSRDRDSRDRDSRHMISRDVRSGRDGRDSTRAHADSRASRSHMDDRASRSHTDDRVSRSHTDDRASRSHTDDRASRAHTDDRASRARVDGRASRAHVDGRAVRAHTDDRAVRAHTDDRAVRAHGKEKESRAHADGRAGSPRHHHGRERERG